ncbi:DUF2863 family protein [Pollutimonas harenae]|uniref:DUF2863 family protein n=1 Tax=Pollutimonas harenae TaxID=657015 RepID=A0A853H2P0_9BURK|nr:DUF2863 family protein [Pollutimonas harenae]NYT86532.1 DUF2863 family protein [Pollutimonas harenae]TEA69726.1 DUF2863 family protein [Pollutimonas harenae]
MPATTPPRLSRDAQRLLTLTEALARSGSRLEDIYWEGLLAVQLNKILLAKKNKTVETALDHLLGTDINAYEILVEQAETLSESTSLTHEGVEYDALLFSAPLVAWTRYQLPQGELTETQLDGLISQMQACVVAPDARLAMVPRLVNFDQMPQTFQETRAWIQHLVQQALGISNEAHPIKLPSELESLLADARFLVGVIVVPKGQPLFRWQTRQDANTFVSREQCHESWAESSTAILAPLFTGCHVEFLQPDAYYVNSREADRRIRPLALKAAVTWLQTAAQLAGGELRAVIAGCGDSAIEEYRIGFSTHQGNEVIYGCIWPVLSKEEAASDGLEAGHIDVPDEIAALLKEMGVSDIRRLPGVYTPEFCDDCGAPYFPNAIGEMLHPELPEETDLTPIHFH